MDVKQLEDMLAKGRDSAMLRFTLGKHYLDQEESAQAIAHLAECVKQDPGYSAAWNLLGKAQQQAGDLDAARQTWEQGLEVAEKKGDVQTSKVMKVSLKRLDKMKQA